MAKQSKKKEPKESSKGTSGKKSGGVAAALKRTFSTEKIKGSVKRTFSKEKLAPPSQKSSSNRTSTSATGSSLNKKGKPQTVKSEKRGRSSRKYDAREQARLRRKQSLERKYEEKESSEGIGEAIEKSNSHSGLPAPPKINKSDVNVDNLQQAGEEPVDVKSLTHDYSAFLTEMEEFVRSSVGNIKQMDKIRGSIDNKKESRIKKDLDTRLAITKESFSITNKQHAIKAQKIARISKRAAIVRMKSQLTLQRWIYYYARDIYRWFCNVPIDQAPITKAPQFLDIIGRMNKLNYITPLIWNFEVTDSNIQPYNAPPSTQSTHTTESNSPQRQPMDQPAVDQDAGDQPAGDQTSDHQVDNTQEKSQTDRADADHEQRAVGGQDTQEQEELEEQEEREEEEEEGSGEPIDSYNSMLDEEQENREKPSKTKAEAAEHKELLAIRILETQVYYFNRSLVRLLSGLTEILKIIDLDEDLRNFVPAGFDVPLPTPREIQMEKQQAPKVYLEPRVILPSLMPNHIEMLTAPCQEEDDNVKKIEREKKQAEKRKRRAEKGEQGQKEISTSDGYSATDSAQQAH